LRLHRYAKAGRGPAPVLSQMGRSISRFLSPQTQERNPIATRERASGGGGQLRQRRGGAGRVDISSLSKKTARGKRTPTRKLGRGPARVLAQMGRSISRFLSPQTQERNPITTRERASGGGGRLRQRRRCWARRQQRLLKSLRQ
jgi:hypothetical protein